MGRILEELMTIADLDHALEQSQGRPLLLFKHSLTCPISARGLLELEAYLEEPDTRVDYRLIVVQNARTVSDAAASRLEIKHETPQAILITDGRAVWHASHWDITSEAIKEATSNVVAADRNAPS